MTRAEYNALRGWTVPADEDPNDDGYLVEYVDAQPGNLDGYKGYVSWSPEDVFDRAYRPSGQMSFGMAIEALKEGQKVARSGWNGNGMFLFLVAGSTFKVNRAPLLGIYPEGTVINYLPHIDMRTATGEIVPWLASQTDMLSNDWGIVE
jgi:hypothetical protein